MSSEEDFTILSSEYVGYEKRGKWSVSTLVWDHRVLVHFPDWSAQKDLPSISLKFISVTKLRRPYLILLSYGFRQKGYLKGEHVLAQGKGRRFLPSVC